jgi:hypothetical protein
LKKEYAAPKIIERLEQLHPFFYPQPVRQIKGEPGHYHLEGIPSGFLTKADLLQLYGVCWDNLHRGNLKKLLSPATVFHHDTNDIAAWGQKIQMLLNHHHFWTFRHEHNHHMHAEEFWRQQSRAGRLCAAKGFLRGLTGA